MTTDSDPPEFDRDLRAAVYRHFRDGGRAPSAAALAFAIAALALALTACSPPSPPADIVDDTPILVAHRGASAYAPEHTLEAYELGIQQGADFIEPDLQITRDGVLIALHDATLDRTTNAPDVFPDRFREVESRGETVRRWFAVDFTLDEIRQLDAGSWFDARFAGARIPTLSEVIELARGRAGIFPETKAPGSYADEGFEMERMLLDELGRHGLERRGADPATPVIVQSFSAESLRVIRHELGSDLHTTFLISGSEAGSWLEASGIEEIATFATGIGPAKQLLIDHPGSVATAQAAGLSVVPWTFRARDPGDFPDVDREMAHFVCELGVDGVFTDNPDRFPKDGDCGPDAAEAQ